MIDFDSALKDSLRIATDRFRTADGDLRELVAAVGKSLSAASAEALFLDIQCSDRPEGTIYKLVVEHKASKKQECYVPSFERDVADFLIPAKGYPIEYGEYNEGGYEFESAGKLENRAALDAHFLSLVSNSESPLMLRAAKLIVRPDEPEETGIPF